MNRFRESDILRHIFERVVMAAMGMGLVKGEGFAVDASVMANASRYHGKAPDELDWTEKQRQKRAVAEYLAALEAEAAIEGDALNESGGSESKRQRRYERQPPKVISPSDPQHGENAPGPKDANPAGLSCDLEIVLAEDAKMAVRSDDAWRCSREEADGWQKVDFDDGKWEKAKVVAKFGEGPWGHAVGAGGRDEFMVPYAAGVPDVVRVVYMPRALSVLVRKLEPDVHYVASTFDPVTGRRDEIGPVRTDADGSWTAAPPGGTDGDWVLLLEARRRGVRPLPAYQPRAQRANSGGCSPPRSRLVLEIVPPAREIRAAAAS